MPLTQFYIILNELRFLNVMYNVTANYFDDDMYIIMMTMNAKVYNNEHDYDDNDLCCFFFAFLLLQRV